MEKDKTLQLFAQVNANNPHLAAWLKDERETAVKYLTQARDPVVIHQAQGRVVFIETMLDLLASAHTHLR